MGALTAWTMWIVHKAMIPSGEWFSIWIVLTGTMVAIVVSLTARLQSRVGRLGRDSESESELRTVHDELTGLATRSEVERRHRRRSRMPIDVTKPSAFCSSTSMASKPSTTVSGIQPETGC